MKKKVLPFHNFLVNALRADFISPSLEKPFSMTNLSFLTLTIFDNLLWQLFGSYCPYEIEDKHKNKFMREPLPLQSWNLDVMVFQPWNLDVVAFCSLKKYLGITMSWDNCLRFSMSRFFGLGISMSWLFGLGLESRCRGICASTASFSFSINLLCHIINVDMWVVNCANYFVSHKLVF